MLTVLFSPSEGKHSGGSAYHGDTLFGLDRRHAILDAYNQVVLSGDTAMQQKMFGLKDETLFDRYRHNIFNAPTCKAFERYNGVAYEYLNYASLDAKAKAFLDTRALIFSNLYGPIRGGDSIGDYKVKQGECIGAIAPERFYATHFSDALDAYLKEHEILDLRAGYYEKFYKLKQPYTTLKFMNEGKVVSHWAKAYRGIVLREIALHRVDTLDAFMKLEIESLHVKEIKEQKFKREIVFDIIV